MRSWPVVFMILCGLTVLLGGACVAAAAQTGTGAEKKKGKIQAIRPVDPKVVEKVRAIAADILGVKPADIDVDVPLSKQKAAADELDLVEIVMALEDAFGIEIRDEDLGGTPAELTATTSVRKLAGIVERKQKR